MRGKTRDLALSALFAALTAAGAFFRIPVGPVPVTLQVLFTLLAGVLLGPRWGAASQAVYVALGLAGLPVFAQGGGLSYLLNPSCGFLFGLVPAAWAAGWLTRGGAGRVRVALSCLGGLFALYLVGLPYLYVVARLYLGRSMDPATLFLTGCLLYLPGDFLKVSAVVWVSAPLLRALGRARDA